MEDTPEQVRDLIYQPDSADPWQGRRRKAAFFVLLLLAACTAWAVWWFGIHESPIRFYGRVVDENGQPVPGAAVTYRVWREHGGQFRVPGPWVPPSPGAIIDGKATTDANGAFSVSDRGRSLVIEHIAHPGYPPLSLGRTFGGEAGGRSGEAYRSNPSTPATFVVTKPPPVVLYGRVIDAKGLPMAGLMVTPLFLEPSGMQTVKGNPVETNSDGGFRVSGTGIGVRLEGIRRGAALLFGSTASYVPPRTGAPESDGAAHIGSPERPIIFQVRFGG